MLLGGFPSKEYFNNSMNSQNKIGGNNFYKNYNDMQGNSDIINNNNYFQQYQLNNNNLNRLININNNYNNDLIFNLKNQYSFKNNNQKKMNKDMSNFNYLQRQNNHLVNKAQDNSLANVINEYNKNTGWIVIDAK